MNLMKISFGGTPAFDKPAKPKKEKMSFSGWLVDKAVNLALNSLEEKWNKDLWDPDK